MKTNPTWWNAEHETRWDKIKSAFKRDWEQTKNDLGSDKARDLQQSATDTVKQATASKQQGAGNAHSRSFEELEPAFRYGYASRQQHTNSNWNDDLERRLKTDYPGDYGRDRDFIRRGYDYPPSA